MRRLVGVLAALSAACSTEQVDLAVDVKTDLTPAVDFFRVEVDIEPGARHAAVNVAPFDDAFSGLRVAEVSGLAPGEYTVVVGVLDRDARRIVERRVRLRLAADFVLMVIVSRDCLGVSCPGPGDPAGATTCVGGRCVDPVCSPADPTACGPGECTSDGACPPSAVACVAPRCVDGECLAEALSRLCAAGEYCDPTLGCRARPDAGLPDAGGVVDAGAVAPDAACPRCAGCGDGNPCTDDSCNCGTCQHQFNTATCDDGNACTTGESCASGACTGGRPRSCDDGNVCTADSCDPASGCVHPASSGACDDGDGCTSLDRCSGGVCVPGAPRDCNDGNDCTDDACSAGACVNTAVVGRACDDGLFCRDPDTCRADGVCRGAIRGTCGPGYVCDEGTMSCVPI